MPYYGHTLSDHKPEDWQILKDHLDAVSEMAATFGESFGMSDFTKVVGLLHDIGKYSNAFQKRLLGAKEKVDHSTAGAQEAMKLYGPSLGRVMAYVLAGHHGGLMNGGKGGEDRCLENRLSKSDLPDFRSYTDEITCPKIGRDGMSRFCLTNKTENGFALSFLIRMMYSCLVDADFLDTERFMQLERYMKRDIPPSLFQLNEVLNQEIVSKCSSSQPTPINIARKQILEECLDASEWASGLYSLTVPTGGGKTLSSLAYGLNHAVRHQKSRVIYVIPYTSIIEQNAKVFRDILGDDAVLEHHSNFEYPDDSFKDWDESSQKHRLAAENWDRPIIVTTAVQFFESLFANKSSRCRKLHNIANSVIILDEAQMMPIDYLKPSLFALCELVRNYHANVVLCTATQPAIGSYLPYGMIPKEIISDPVSLQETFKRTEIELIGALSDEELALRLHDERQVLCIVNTRKHAALLYAALSNYSETTGVYHLSARMCPVHRSIVLDEIRKRLIENKPCRVISTQLVEAGVDVDFPVVYRSESGIDSVTQAAGRCNREGKRDSGKVYVFTPEVHGMPKLGNFRLCSDIMRRTAARYEKEPFGLSAIHSYFEELYDWQSDVLDKKKILQRLSATSHQLSFPFEDIGYEFSLIESFMIPIVVPFNDDIELLRRRLNHHPCPSVYTRKLQRFTVQVYPYEFEALKSAGAISETKVGELFWFLDDKKYYDSVSGLLDAKEVSAQLEVCIF